MAKRPAWTNLKYGLDAPGVVLTFLIVGCSGLVVGSLGFFLLISTQIPFLALTLAVGGGCAALVGFGTVFLMVRSSRIGKLAAYRRLLAGLALQGYEQVLDVGCGRGFLLIEAAQQLTTGKAFGVDIWRKTDQAGNNPIATLANARLAGVLNRVEIRRNDIRHLSFDKAYFEIIVSALVLHNLPTAADRQQALSEIVRVLKPGGRLALLDFQYTSEYANFLQAAGLESVERSGLYFSMYPPVRIVTARKPAPLNSPTYTEAILAQSSEKLLTTEI